MRSPSLPSGKNGKGAENPIVNRMKKQHLPQKVCPACNRPFTWRRKWKQSWDEVIWCSERCRRNKNKPQVENE